MYYIVIDLKKYIKVHRTKRDTGGYEIVTSLIQILLSRFRKFSYSLCLRFPCVI